MGLARITVGVLRTNKTPKLVRMKRRDESANDEYGLESMCTARANEREGAFLNFQAKKGAQNKREKRQQETKIIEPTFVNAPSIELGI